MLKVIAAHADEVTIDKPFLHTIKADLPRLQKPAKMLAFVVLACALALAGAWLSLRAFSGQTVNTRFAKVTTQAHLASHGSLSLSVPVVDWGVTARAKGLPLAVDAQIDAIDRAKAAGAIGPDPATPRKSLAQVKADGRRVVEATLRRAFICIFLGCLAGGLIAGALCGAAWHRRSLLIWGLACGLLLPLAFTPSTLSAVHSLRSADVDNVDFTGNGKELGRVVAFAEQLLYVKDDYQALYTRALSSVANVLGFASAKHPALEKGQTEKSVLMASDLHDNVLVTDAFGKFAGNRTVFMAGDFGQVGAKIERGLASDVAGLGSRVVAVSGNHDSADFMTALARKGVTVLTSDGLLKADATVDKAQVIVVVDGMKVAGYTDPLQTSDSNNQDHVLRVHGGAYEQQAGDLIKWFDHLPERPDVVVIHQHGLAHRLMEHLASKGDDKKLLIICGHDHVAHVDEDGPRLLVDGGSIGAGGPFAVGEQPSAFVQLRVLVGGFKDPTVSGADLVAIDPLSGASAARHIELSGSGERTWFADGAGQLAGELPAQPSAKVKTNVS